MKFYNLKTGETKTAEELQEAESECKINTIFRDSFRIAEFKDNGYLCVLYKNDDCDIDFTGFTFAYRDWEPVEEAQKSETTEPDRIIELEENIKYLQTVNTHRQNEIIKLQERIAEHETKADELEKLIKKLLSQVVELLKQDIKEVL